MKIGIIGSGGAGTCAAWLLDEKHDVTVFEKRNYLGGHTHSVDVEVNGRKYVIDDGAAWFSPRIYPYFNAYMDIVGVKYDWLPLSLTYHHQPNNHSNCMPPNSARNIFKLFTRKNLLRELWSLNKAVNAAKHLVTRQDGTEDFATFMEKLPVSEKVKSDFIRPLLTGGWGAPFGQVDGFSIYPLMKYIVYHKPSRLQCYNWKIMRGGTVNYISTVFSSLKRTEHLLNSEVLKIEKDVKRNKVIVSTNTATYEFDKLIITGGAKDAGAILKDCKDYQKPYEILNQFKYYKATLATHSDPKFMPPVKKDWSVVNVTYDGTNSFATIWHGSKTGAHIFCSYLNPEEEMPTPLHNVSEWWLPCETPRYFELQKELAAVQGHDNVFFAGDYTHDIGCHEDAIFSAVKAVEKIEPGLSRLAQLKRGASAQSA